MSIDAEEEHACNYEKNNILIIEYQRLHWAYGWSYGNDHPEDPRRFCPTVTDSFASAKAREDVMFNDGDDFFDRVVGGFHEASDDDQVLQWVVALEVSDSTENEGWQYNSKFVGSDRKWQIKRRDHSFVRRRFWRQKKINNAMLGVKRESSFSEMEGESHETVKTFQKAVRCGYLHVRKLLNLRDQRRFMVLYPTALVIYECEPWNFDISQFEPLEIIPLKEAIVRTTPRAPPTRAPVVVGIETTVDVPIFDAAESSPEDQTFALTILGAKESFVFRCETRRENGAALNDVAAWEAEAVAEARAWMHAIELCIDNKPDEAAGVGEVRLPVDARMVSKQPTKQKKTDNMRDDAKIDRIYDDGINACNIWNCVVS